MTRSGLVGLLLGLVFAAAYGLYASVIGMGSDGALAWHLAWLPILLGVIAAIWGLFRSSTNPIGHLALFAAAAAVGHGVLEEILIGTLGEDVTKRTAGNAVGLTFVLFAATMAVGAIIIGFTEAFRVFSRWTKKPLASSTPRAPRPTS